jgi:hypothetical protein
MGFVQHERRVVALRERAERPDRSFVTVHRK